MNVYPFKFIFCPSCGTNLRPTKRLTAAHVYLHCTGRGKKHFARTKRNG